MNKNHITTKTKRIIHPNSLANLKPVQPGEKLNPIGRPKGSSITEHVRDKLRLSPERADAIAEKWIRELEEFKTKDKAALLREILDRDEGKVPDGLKHSGTINLVVEYRDKPVDDDDVAYDSQVNI